MVTTDETTTVEVELLLDAYKHAEHPKTEAILKDLLTEACASKTIEYDKGFQNHLYGASKHCDVDVDAEAIIEELESEDKDEDDVTIVAAPFGGASVPHSADKIDSVRLSYVDDSYVLWAERGTEAAGELQSRFACDVLDSGESMVNVDATKADLEDNERCTSAVFAHYGTGNSALEDTSRFSDVRYSVIDGRGLLWAYGHEPASTELLERRAAHSTEEDGIYEWVSLEKLEDNEVDYQ